jgi:hypothetical protein
MGGHGLTARCLHHTLDDALAILLRKLLNSENHQRTASPNEIASDETEAIERLITAGWLHPLDEGAGIPKCTQKGVYLLETVVRLGVAALPRPNDVPHFDGEAVLIWKGQVVKRWKRTADNQHPFLRFFEACGWSAVIPDQLPPDNALDPKERIRETVKS